MFSERGFISFRMIVVMLALIGAWALYHAYRDGAIGSMLHDVVSDYSTAARETGIGEKVMNSPLVEKAVDTLKR